MAGSVERHFLVQRGADALRKAAINLAVDDHRIDQHATILDDHIVEDLDRAEIGVDRDGHRVGCIAESAAVAPRLVTARRFQPARIDIGRQVLRAAVPGMCNFGEPDAAAGSAHPAVPQRNHRRIKLKKLGANSLGAFADLGACGRNRTTGHDHRARTPGAGRVGRERGIAVHDPHIFGFNAEDFIGDLSERGLEALTMRMHTHPDFEPAVGRHARIGLLVSWHHWNAPAGIDRGAVRGLLAIDREADADQPPVRFLCALTRPHRRDVDGRQRAPHGLRIIAAVEMLFGDVVEWHFIRADQIAQPDLAGFNAGCERHCIQHDFQREADAGAGHAAIGQDRTFIGRDRKGPAAIGRHPVRTRQDARHLRGLEAG